MSSISHVRSNVMLLEACVRPSFIGEGEGRGTVRTLHITCTIERNQKLNNKMFNDQLNRRVNKCSYNFSIYAIEMKILRQN